jgi:Lon protease-like protein
VSDPLSFDPAGFSGTIPLFPLPNVVLFPGNALPLHVFEPRYRALARAALDGERLVGMALLKPGWDPATEGEPPIHEVMGMGKIIEDVELVDGRRNLLLIGVARVKVLEELSSKPFRKARVEILRDRGHGAKGLERRRRLLLAFYAQLIREQGKGKLTAPPDDLPLGLICDLLVPLIGFDPGVKQGMLEEIDISHRSERLLGLLKSLEAKATAWPPKISLN